MESSTEVSKPVLTPADVLTKLIKLKDKRRALESEYQASVKALDNVIDRAEAYLLTHMQESGQDGFAVRGVGRVEVRTKLTPIASDWRAIDLYLRDTGNFGLLHRRITSSAVVQYMKDHGGAPPPGVSVTTERVVRVVRSQSNTFEEDDNE